MPSSLQQRALHLALAGSMIEPLEHLLEDVLADSGLRYELIALPDLGDIVLVLVNWGEELQVIAEIRALSGKVPLLAILPFSDDEMAQRVLHCGAQGWIALDASLELLLMAMVQIVGLDPPAEKDAA